MSTRYRLLPLLIGQAVLLGLWAVLRIVNADEGIVLQAARRVGEGQALYREVFFMHPPLTAYLYAPVAGWGEAGLLAARVLAVLASLAATALVARAAFRLTADRRAAGIAFALFALNGLTLAWHSTATTLVWGDALGFAGLFLLTAARDDRRRLLLAGVLVGLAACARLTHGLLGVVALGWLLMGPGPRVARAGAFVLGGVMGFAPALAHLAADPEAFLLGTVVFRQVWGAEVVAMPLVAKAKVFLQFVLYPQNLLVLALFAWSARLRGGLGPEERRAWGLYAAAAAALTALYLAVTPTQTHYFAETLPFLVAASAPALARLGPRLTRRRLALAGVLYAACIGPYAALFIGGMRAKDRRYRRATVEAVTDVLARCTAPGDSVLSFNQHAPVLARRPAAHGLEVGGPAVVPRLSPAQQRASGLLTEASLRRVLVEGHYVAVVYEPTFLDDGPAPLASRYRRVFGQDSVAVYVRRDVECGEVRK